MSEKLCIIVMIALAAAFVVLLVKKWGIAEWMQIHGDAFTSKLFSCDLCMGFWANFLITIVVMCITDDASLIVIPIMATPITRMLV